MQTIKHFKQQPNKKKLNGVTNTKATAFVKYLQGSVVLPSAKKKVGISEWFNYKGLTWIIMTSMKCNYVVK